MPSTILNLLLSRTSTDEMGSKCHMNPQLNRKQGCNETLENHYLFYPWFLEKHGNNSLCVRVSVHVEKNMFPI